MIQISKYDVYKFLTIYSDFLKSLGYKRDHYYHVKVMVLDGMTVKVEVFSTKTGIRVRLYDRYNKRVMIGQKRFSIHDLYSLPMRDSPDFRIYHYRPISIHPEVVFKQEGFKIKTEDNLITFNLSEGRRSVYENEEFVIPNFR